MSRLVIIGGAEAGTAFELDGPESVIGRQAGTQIRLEGQKVSRRHARVYRDGAAFRLEDLGSSNGTFLNGLRVQDPVTLRGGEQIGIGPHLLRFETGEAPPEYTIRARTAANTANAELYRGNAAHKLQVILRLSLDLGRSLDLSDLLREVLNHLFALFPQAERGLVILFEGGRPTVRAQKQRSGGAQNPRFSASVVRKVAAEGAGIVAEDLLTDSRFADAQSLCALGLRSFMCVPLQTKGGDAFGVLQLERMGAGHEFSSEDLNMLTAIALQVSVALDNAQLHEQLIARQRIENEVAVAREIQLSYLPTEPPVLAQKNFEVYAELVPAYEISGDFYDYFKMKENHLGLGVGDVSGKGIPAALFMSMVRALLRNFAELEGDPGMILRDLNNAITQQNPKCQFVTLSFCVFDPARQMIEIASGGHPPPFLRRADGVVEAVAIKQGPLLGFAKTTEPYPVCRLQMHPGELLVLYTDGIVEAPGPGNVMVGQERFRTLLAEVSMAGSLKQSAEGLQRGLQNLTGNRPQEDDITLALLRMQ